MTESGRPDASIAEVTGHEPQISIRQREDEKGNVRETGSDPVIMKTDEYKEGEGTRLKHRFSAIMRRRL